MRTSTGRTRNLAYDALAVVLAAVTSSPSPRVEDRPDPPGTRHSRQGRVDAFLSYGYPRET